MIGSGHFRNGDGVGGPRTGVHADELMQLAQADVVLGFASDLQNILGAGGDVLGGHGEAHLGHEVGLGGERVLSAMFVFQTLIGGHVNGVRAILGERDATAPFARRGTIGKGEGVGAGGGLNVERGFGHGLIEVHGELHLGAG